GHMHAIGPMTEVREVELEASVAREIQQRLDLADVPRFSVRRKAHDLELVAVFRKAEILRDGEIQQAERVRKEHAAVHVQRRAGDTPPGRADEIAETVNRADGGVVERADEGRAGEMRGVMLDVPHPRADDVLVEAD